MSLREQTERIVYAVHLGRQKDRLEALRGPAFRQLLGTEMYFFDSDRPGAFGDVHLEPGALLYRSWHDVPLSDEGLLPTEYTIVSTLHPRAQIYAPETRYKKRRQVRVNILPDAETAIRAMDHILEGEHGREADQAQAIAGRAHDLLTLFSEGLSQINRATFDAYQQETYQTLAQVNLDPEKVISEEKRRMAKWLIKGSYGRDTLERLNWLIAVGALTAAHRRAILRHKDIGRIAAKYAAMREALIIEREFSRTVIADVIDKIDPQRFPAHRLFKFPRRTYPAQDAAIAIGMLNTMVFQLKQPHVAPYQGASREASKTLETVVALLGQGKRAEIARGDYFVKTADLLTDTLEASEEI